jgi:hypothetical protein
MIANRPQIDRPRPPARLLRAGLFVDGRPFPALPMAVAITALRLTPTSTAPSTSPVDGRVSLTDERG